MISRKKTRILAIFSPFWPVFGQLWPWYQCQRLKLSIFVQVLIVLKEICQKILSNSKFLGKNTIFGHFWPFLAIFGLFLAIYDFSMTPKLSEIVYLPQFLLGSSEKPDQIMVAYSKQPKNAFLPQKWPKNGFLKGVPKKYSKMKVRFVFSMKKYVRIVKFQSFMEISYLHLSFCR